MTQCGWCGNYHGVRCPEVKSIEYYPNGTVKKVEFVSDSPSVAVSSGTAGVDIVVLPDGTTIGGKPLTFNQDLGGHY